MLTSIRHPRVQNSQHAAALAIVLPLRTSHMEDYPQPVGTINFRFLGAFSAMPANVAREFNEKGAAYAKDAYGKTQAAAGEATKVMEQTYSAASKGVADFNLHLLDIAQTNINATFDFARQLTQVKSPTEFFELAAAHMRKQIE